MKRRRYKLLRRGKLNYHAAVHDGDAVGNVRRKRKIMRHDHLRYAAVGAHGDKLIGNVSARHCVKGACRLVCKQKLLLHEHHKSKRDTLVHAAAHFIRAGGEYTLAVGKIQL